MRILRGLLPGDIIIIIIIIISRYSNFLLPMNFRSSDLLKIPFLKISFTFEESVVRVINFHKGRRKFY